MTRYRKLVLGLLVCVALQGCAPITRQAAVPMDRTTEAVPLGVPNARYSVLEHEGAGVLRPVEQREATFERQDRPGRKLVGGCDIHEAGSAGPSPKLGRIEAVAIYRDRNQASAGGREDLGA